MLLVCAGVLASAASKTPSAAPASDFAYAEPYFESVGDSESIPLGLVTAQVQDGKGLLWIGTEFGLIRFDGYRFRKFTHNPRDPHSLGGDFVRFLWVGPDNKLWIGTGSDGLSVLDMRSELFQNFRHDVANLGGLSGSTVTALSGDAHGGMWIGTDQGLDYLPPGSQTFKHYRHAPAASQSLADDRVRSLLFDKQGVLWVGTADGLQRMDDSQTDFERVASNPDDHASLAGQEIRSLFEAADGKLWLGTRNRGAAWLDPRTRQLHWLARELVPAVDQPEIRAIAQPQAEQIWLASYGAGIDIVAADDGRLVQRLRHDPSILSSLAIDQIGSLLRDRSGLLWIGTGGGGLQRHDPRNRAVRMLRHSPVRPAGLSHPDIRSMLELADGRLLIGTGGNGIDVLDRAAGLVAGYRPAPGKPGGLADGKITALASASDGTLWAGTRLAGVQRLAAGADSWQGYGLAQGLPDIAVRRLLITRAGELMVATDRGLARWRVDSQRFETFNSADGSPMRAASLALAEDAQGRVWIASGAGLWLLEPGASALQVITHEPARESSLSSDRATGLLVDSQDRLWVDTPEGLDRLRSWDGKRADFDHISELVGRPGLYFGPSLLEDSLGRIWSQWFVLDPQQMRLYPLSKAEGLDIGTAWIASYGKTRDGLFLYGGTQGLAIIDPEQYQPSDYAPPVVVSALTINGKALPEGMLDQGLTLAPEQRNFSVEFAALDYSAPEKLRYSYRLLGYERDWIETDASRRNASYGNLWPGSYTLQVRGSNRLGAWSPHELRVEVRVLPAFWQTGWFISLVLLALGAFLYGSYRWRLARLRREAVTLQTLVDARTADILQLGEIGKELTATLDTEQAFTRVHKQASARLDTHVFSIGIYEQAAGLIRRDYLVEGGQRQTATSFSMAEHDRPAVWCVRERRELRTASNAELLNYVASILPPKYGDPMESIIYLPLIVEQQVVGCLSVQSPLKNAYNSDQLEFLRVLASYTAIAISNSRAHGELATAHKELAAAHEHTQQTQQQLILKEKMAGLGTLTAGVAHEINNPTNFVHVAAQNLRVDVIEFQQFIGSLIEADEAPDILLAITERFAKLSGHINTMLNGTERIKTIVKDLRAVTRHDQSEKTTIRMSECLLSTLNLVRSNWHEQIDFISEFIDDPEITCWPALLNQVFMNLLVNAAQSITERAKLDSTEHGRICIRTQINGDKLKIDFSDNGIGMSPELQTRILEPFFTTKAVGAGTGLGLSISYGIILQHAGELQIHSTLGRGSCFSVRLPLSEQAPDGSN